MPVPRYRSSPDLASLKIPAPTYVVKNLSGSILGSGTWGEPIMQGSYYAFPPYIQSMTDVVGNQGSYNPVNQKRLISSFSNLEWSNSINGGEFWKVTSKDDVFPVPLLFDERSVLDWPFFPQPSAAQLSDWSIEAYTKFNEQVPAKVSLANSMYELREIKGLIPKIDRQSASKTASGNFLAYQFGVLPMIGDIKAIANTLPDVEKRLKHLIAMNGKESKLSFDRKLVIEPGGSIWRSLWHPYQTSEFSGNVIRFVQKNAKINFNVGASLYQDLKDLEASTATLKALTAQFGLNRPATVVWNALPYSFVVDWFFHVGKILDTLSIQPFGGTYEVSNVGYSVKTEAQWFAYLQLGDIPYLQRYMGTVTAKSYERKTGFPVSSPFLTDASLSPTQQVLGLAMLNQRR